MGVEAPRDRGDEDLHDLVAPDLQGFVQRYAGRTDYDLGTYYTEDREGGYYQGASWGRGNERARCEPD